MSASRARQVTKSVRFSAEESALLSEISRREHLAEGTLLRKLVLDGLAQYRLEQAVADYEGGELNLGEAAHRAGVSIQRLMAELERRGVDRSSPMQVVQSLETLTELFGASPELRETVQELRARHTTTR
jgi:hypothetical protein